jgi:hypothetical protein
MISQILFRHGQALDGLDANAEFQAFNSID